MSNNADQITELLNGLLDGVLTDDEQRRLDLAMREDPSLEERLEEMQAMRRSLLRGRSVGRLGPDFSKGVVAAAKKRAEMMGAQAPEWLQTPVQRSADRVAKRVPPPANPRIPTPLPTKDAVETSPIARRAVRFWVPMALATAVACIALYFGSPYLAPPPLGDPLVGELNGNRPVIEGADVDANAKATELLAVESRKNSENSVASSDADRRDVDRPDNNSSVAAATPPIERMEAPEATNAVVGSDASMLANDSTQSESTSTDSAFPSPSEADRTMSAVAASDTPSNTKATNPIMDALANKGITDPVFTLVADVTVDPVAQQNDALRSLLDEHEILYADDLNLSSEQLETLVDSRMVGSLSNDRAQRENDDVRVFFVRARATRIDAFLVALEGQFRDFPQYRLDMSFDPSVLQLSGQLSTVITTDSAAKRLTYSDSKGLGLVSTFPAGAAHGQPIALDRRMETAKQAGAPKKVVTDAVSYLILIVRNQPEN